MFPSPATPYLYGSNSKRSKHHLLPVVGPVHLLVVDSDGQLNSDRAKKYDAVAVERTADSRKKHLSYRAQNANFITH